MIYRNERIIPHVNTFLRVFRFLRRTHKSIFHLVNLKMNLAWLPCHTTIIHLTALSVFHIKDYIGWTIVSIQQQNRIHGQIGRTGNKCTVYVSSLYFSVSFQILMNVPLVLVKIEAHVTTMWMAITVLVLQDTQATIVNQVIIFCYFGYDIERMLWYTKMFR